MNRSSCDLALCLGKVQIKFMRDRCKLSFACPVAASSPAYVLVWLASLAQIGELSRSLLQDKSSKPEISVYTY